MGLSGRVRILDSNPDDNAEDPDPMMMLTQQVGSNKVYSRRNNQK
jgi:hypothetical protein